MVPISRTEREILTLICLGHDTKQIADYLGVTSRTVYAHVQALKRKAGVRERSGLVIWGLRVMRQEPVVEHERHSAECPCGRCYLLSLPAA